MKTQKTIIEYIPYFFNYCKDEKRLSSISIKNYRNFLKKFIDWLKLGHRDLLPNQLSPIHIREYKEYLSLCINTQTNKPISLNTQNYYLRVLRSLFLYFEEIGIPSLSPNKVKLSKRTRTQVDIGFLNFNFINRMLSTPNLNTLLGLRDRILLEVLFSTGIKVSQLVSINRDRIKFINANNLSSELEIYNENNLKLQTVIFSDKVTKLLQKYMTMRSDTDQALFINLSPNKKVSKRLTVRSVEIIVKKYAEKAGPLLSFTPEVLRNVRFFSILNQEKEIKIKDYASSHNNIIVEAPLDLLEDNKFIFNSPKFFKNEKIVLQPWHIIEGIIDKEVNWLKNSIDVMPEKYRNSHNLPFFDCDNCILRKLALLIVSGKIKALEINTKNNNLWEKDTSNSNLISYHGEEWHRKMISVVYNYFKQRDYKLFIEPNLNYGRADLGVCLNPNKVIFIEIGTVFLFKLWYNLSLIRDAIFLIIPSKNKIIVLKT